nr:hypothetical protein [Prevotella sp.]
MAKDAEIEQGLSLPNEERQRKKQRLPHSQKKEVEKPQKRKKQRTHSAKGLQTILPERI